MRIVDEQTAAAALRVAFRATTSAVLTKEHSEDVVRELSKTELDVVLTEAGWRPMFEYPRGYYTDVRREPVLAKLHDDLAKRLDRDDLSAWNGRVVVVRHPGVTPAKRNDPDWDPGWNLDAPVGHGGFPDDWFVGWMELPR